MPVIQHIFKSGFFLALVVAIGTISLADASNAPCVNCYREINKKIATDANKSLKERDFKDSEADLPLLVKVGQIAELLGETQSDAACNLLSKGLKHLNQESPRTLYYLAEASRLFKCKSLDKIASQISASLADAKNLDDINDLYYLFLLQKGAASYGVNKSKAFDQFLLTKAKEDWLVNFNTEDWSYNQETKGKGLTLESLRIAQILAYLQATPDVKDKVETKLKAALEKLLKQAYEDENIWFIVTKNANEVDNTEMNLEILKIAKEVDPKHTLVKAENLVKFRNYFFQKAIGAQSINDFNHALRGLSILKEYPFVHTDDSSIINIGDSKAQIKFEFVDMLGSPVAGIKNVKVSLKSSTNALVDATKNAKLNKENNVLTFTPAVADLALGPYTIIFEVESTSAFNLNSSIKVVDKIKVNSLSYKIEATQQFPESFDRQITFPNEIKESKNLDIQEGYYLHLAVKAAFTKQTKDRPKQVYLSLKKKDSEKNLFQNVYAHYNSAGERYEITLDVSNDLEHLNGEYDLEIHVADSKASERQLWHIGKAHIWFKQGQETGNNQGILEQFQPKTLINHIFPSEQKERNILVPLIGVGAITVALLFFLKQICSYTSNVSNLNFTGILLLANILLILGIFTMFWLHVKLIPTLWILSFIAVPSFLIVNKALVHADCNIAEVAGKVSRKKDQ